MPVLLTKFCGWCQNCFNEHLEIYSSPEMLKPILLMSILARFWPSGQKCSKWVSWGLFWLDSRHEARSAQNEPPEAYSGQVLALRPEVLKMSLLRPILARFWPWDQKCSKWASWGLFWPGSGLGTRNAQKEPPETYSGQLWAIYTFLRVNVHFHAFFTYNSTPGRPQKSDDSSRTCIIYTCFYV